MLRSIDIQCRDCIETMAEMEPASVDLVVTSPPYNMTSRAGGYADTGRYDVYTDWKTEDEYVDWTLSLFSGFDRVLKKDSAVVYNFSYSIENPALPYRLVADLQAKSSFALVDTVIWKKASGLPFPANLRRLSRIWEFIWIFARKDELGTFRVHKKVSRKSAKTGQTYWKVHYNLVEARNNDEPTPELNQATYSSELVLKLLDIYAADGYTVFDPFNGTGTTGLACKMSPLKDLAYVGSEISERQVRHSLRRIGGWQEPEGIDSF